MSVKINEEWRELLEDEFNKDYFKNLIEFVRNEYKTKTIYPPASKIFSAFDTTPPSQLKLVILGQDPYQTPGFANGLSFSVNEGIRIPRSLSNIFKEIQSDIGSPIPASGNLERWAKQGVLLLNATLTVESGISGSHQKKGWEEFTNSVIKTISDKKENIIFLLWGNYAKAKEELIDTNKHFVLKASHPSPFSADKGFFGTKHFSKTNEILKKLGKEPIQW